MDDHSYFYGVNLSEFDTDIGEQSINEGERKFEEVIEIEYGQFDLYINEEAQTIDDAIPDDPDDIARLVKQVERQPPTVPDPVIDDQETSCEVLEAEHGTENVIDEGLGPNEVRPDDHPTMALAEKSTEPLLDKDGIAAYVDSSKNRNTTRKTNQVVNAFQKWLGKFCDETRPIHEIGAQELDQFICNYIVGKKKANGEEHEPDTLTSIHRGILRRLKDMKYGIDPLKDPRFEMSREVLHAKRIKLKAAGKGNRPNRAEAITVEEMELLWERGSLGMGDPETLQETVFFFFEMGFGLRGNHEAVQMCFGDVELKTDTDGVEYLEYTEKITKTRGGNTAPRAFPPRIWATQGDRCPVWFFKEYRSRRPQEMLDLEAPMFLTPHPTATIDDEIGYIRGNMGINTMGGIVKTVCKKGGVAGKKTNHSLRKSSIGALMGAQVPTVYVAQHSGHKNEGSIAHYNTANRAHQRAMSYIVSATAQGGRGGHEMNNALPEPPVSGDHLQVAAIKRKSTGYNPSFANTKSSTSVPMINPKKKKPSAAMGRPPSPGPFQESLPGDNEGEARQIVPDNTASSTSIHRDNIQRLASSVQGMFANAAITGNINLTINYNVSSSQNASVNMSPTIPNIKDV